MINRRDHNIITAKGFGFVKFAVEVCDYMGGFLNLEQKEQFLEEYIARQKAL